MKHHAHTSWAEIMAISERLASIEVDTESEIEDQPAWDPIQELAIQRQILLEDFFQNAQSIDVSDADDLREILKWDRQLLTRLVAARMQLGAKLKRINVSKKAIASYAPR